MDTAPISISSPEAQILRSINIRRIAPSQKENFNKLRGAGIMVKNEKHLLMFAENGNPSYLIGMRLNIIFID